MYRERTGTNSIDLQMKKFGTQIQRKDTNVFTPYWTNGIQGSSSAAASAASIPKLT